MRRTVGVGVVLLLATLLPVGAVSAQQSGSDERAKFRLGQTYTHPFTSATRITFELEPELFESGRPVYVTIRVKDLLGRPIATPVAVGHPVADPVVEHLEYAEPGLMEAEWDGTDRAGRRVAPAAYLLELVVNGERAPPRRLVMSQ